MKKLFLLLLSAMLIFTAMGCSSNPPTEEPPAYVPSNDPFVNLQNMLKSGDKLFGIAFIYSRIR
ncbi:MAG: hypothetical protein J6A61_03390 [Clostridia bacterium]|nr:hypothetical protein [Clostridia bacterium]